MKPIRLGFFAVLLVLLGACQITVTPVENPFDNAKRVNASSPDEETPPVLDSDSVSANSPRYYRVNVPSGVNDPLLFLEAVPENGPIQIRVFNDRREALADSNNRAYFTRPGQLSSLEADGLDPQSIVRESICLGPCVSLRNTRSHVYVRVSTTRSTPVEYEFFAYDQRYGDATEPENNDCSGIGTSSGLGLQTIVVEPEEDEYEGALETLGDADCFRLGVQTTRITLETTSNNAGIEIRAEIYDADTGALLDVVVVTPSSRREPSKTFSARFVDLRITSNNDRAGPSGNSKYTVIF